MSDGDEPASGSPDDVAFPGRQLLPSISLPLHEALGLCLLFQEATPELVQSLKIQNVSYAFSAAYGYLRLREAIARLYGDQGAVEDIAAERAVLDQVQERWVS